MWSEIERYGAIQNHSKLLIEKSKKNFDKSNF